MKHLLKQVAKSPREHSTKKSHTQPNLRHPEMYTLCRCGNWKVMKAKRCRECHFKTIKTDHPYGFDACSQCGNWKKKESIKCRNCRRIEKRPPILNKIFYLEGEPCRKIPLTRGYYAIVDARNYIWLMKFPWHLHWSGPDHRFYAVAYIAKLKRTVRMHRMILGLLRSPKQGDHRNGNGLDNRESNLRTATPKQSAANTKKRSDNTTGFIGVCKLASGRFFAQIQNDGRNRYLGTFDTSKEAALAYDCEARRLRGDFAVLNFPNG